MKIVKIAILFLMVLIPINCSDVSLFFEEAKCQRCECYRIKCARLNRESDCKDEFTSTCDNKLDIKEDILDCNSQCDCCLENKCYLWNSYDCIMYRSMHFSIFFYVFMIILMIYSIEKFYLMLFNINYFYNFKNEYKTESKQKEYYVEKDIFKKIKILLFEKKKVLDSDMEFQKVVSKVKTKFFIRPTSSTFDDSKYN
jgi:hypothetical protein